MLKHKLSILYIFLWIVLAAIQFLVLYKVYALPVSNSLGDSLVFNIIFAVLGSGLWFASQYIDLRKRQILEIFSQHVTGLTIALLVWMLGGTSLLKLLFSDDTVYLHFLHTSQTIRIITGIFYYIVLVTIFNLILTYRELQNRLQREAQLTTQLKEAELSMLRSQIRPHFLFNSLNSISSLTMTDPDKAQDMIIKLSEFMRYSLNFPDEKLNSLEKEFYHMQLYLDIEKVRFGDKLLIEKYIDDNCLICKIPAMILQPLIENAVKYGVYEATEQNRIQLYTFCDVGEICQESTDPNAEMICGTPKLLTIRIINNFDPEATHQKGTGTGLRNVRKRLETVYGMRDLMTVRTEGINYITEIKFPQYG